MNRNAWCFWMAIGCGGFLGVLAGLASPAAAAIGFLALTLGSTAQVMRIDDRAFWQRLREGKD